MVDNELSQGYGLRLGYGSTDKTTNLGQIVIRITPMDAMTLKEASIVFGRAGAKARTRASYVIAATNSAKQRWATRRARYGETGQRPVNVRLRARLEGKPSWREYWSDWSI